jgi:hypothetical protein
MNTRTVYPVPGYFLQTQPAIEHECDDPFCTDSGAFTTERPGAAPVRKRRSKRRAPTAAPAQAEGPAETGGSSDSSEEN